MTRTLRDDLGHEVVLPDTPVCRVVSLVPSLTEAVALTKAGALVGATDWCTHPGDLDVARVRGTKNPDRAAIVALQPDLVIANKEENRELDVTRLREAGVAVWVTDIETVPQSLASMRRLLVDVCVWEEPQWLVEAERTLADVAGAAGVSIQYLSEVERGLKEPSSEILGAVGGALGLGLADLTSRVSRSLGRISGPLALAA